MADFIGAIDQGTTSTRFIIFTKQGSMLASYQLEHEQIYPQPGWVEHDALEIWQRTQEVIQKGLNFASIEGSQLAAVGITNQRETTVVWDKRTGKPYYNAIVWQDTRTDQICQQLADNGGQDRFREKTGLPLTTYFSGPKIKWLLDNVDGLRADAEAGARLVWHDRRLADLEFDRRAHHRCDQRQPYDADGSAHPVLGFRNPQRTGDPRSNAPRNPPLQRPGILRHDPPKTVPLKRPVPICGDLGDQQAALFGQTCFNPGEAKNTYGTGCFMLMNTGEQMVPSKHWAADHDGLPDRE